MKSPISFLLLLATATTGAAGYHAVRRASSINNSTDDVDVNVNNGCPLCTCDAAPSTTSDDNIIEASILMLDVQGIIDMVLWNARDYEKFTEGRVKINIKTVPTMPALFEEIESDARNGGGLYDAYYTNPLALGTAVSLGGLLDLTKYVKESKYSEWTDVLLALRTHVTSFEDKVYLILLDGDTHTMYYRKDVLGHFGLPVPRTWNEYIDVARQVHGQTYKNKTLSGSCVSRVQGDHAQYWSHLILSTITQKDGTETGSLFDTSDMAPLTGEAVVEMLRIQEEQAKYGTSNEFSEGLNTVMNGAMNGGECVLTYMWGDMFRRSMAEGSVLGDDLGISQTPGSDVVLDRSTGKLVKCTEELCPYAKYYDDIGLVNSAPYAANGGWCGAVSANTTPEKQDALAEFFLWASSGKQSDQYVIPNPANVPIEQINGQDPWRRSHLDVDKWVEAGFDRQLAKQFVDSIFSNLNSKNVVVEPRFPKAGEIITILDKEVNEYLVRAHEGGSIPEDKKQEERLEVSQSLTNQWNMVIKQYNERGDTKIPILTIYQRLRGVYNPDQDMNQLTSIRPVGYTLMSIILASSLVSLCWVIKYREKTIVKSAQPQFLFLLILGIVIMGLAIVPMGLDDSVASIEGASIACMVTPWMVVVGFSLTFAALFSKVWRLNRLMKNAASFRRVTVTTGDVMLPLVALLVLDILLLSVWTALDPLQYTRETVGRRSDGTLQSVGNCASPGTTSTVIASLLFAINFILVTFAGIQVYQARRVTVAYHESKFISLALASIFQSFVLGLPLLLLSGSNPVSRYVVQLILVFAVCISIIGFIFLPKMFRPLLANGPESRLGATYVSNTRGGASRLSSNVADIRARASRLSSQESMGSNPVEPSDASGGKAAQRNSQNSLVSMKDDKGGDEVMKSEKGPV